MSLLSRGVRVAGAAWNEALHPRDSHGRFKPKLSHSVRVSPISASYNAGARWKVTRHTNVYTGVLVRVENDRLQQAGKAAITKALGKRADSPIGRLLRGEDLVAGGHRVRRTKVIHPPTVRVARTVQPQGKAVVPHAGTYTTGHVRKPRAPRKPRVRAGHKAITAGKRVR